MQKEEERLTMAVVTQVLQDLFGMGAMLSSTFIRKVEPVHDAKVLPTLGIAANGTLYYNPGFFNKHVNTQRKLQEIIFHELLHPVLGDMHRRHSYIANFASDMVINALIGKVLGHCDLMMETYPSVLPDPEDSIGGLLRPETDIRADGKKFQRAYRHLWKDWGRTRGIYDPRTGGMTFKNKDIDSIEEVREFMEILLSRHQGKPVMLIGSHNHQVNDMGGRNDPMDPTAPALPDGSTDEISAEIKEIMADEIVDLLQKSAGHSDHLTDMAIRTIKANATMVRKLLEDFSAASEFNAFKRYMKQKKKRRTVFPKNLSRRDAVLVACGIDLVFYQNERTHLNPRKDGMNVYIDVSGSMWGELPKILGFLKATKGFVDGIYQFSNKVVGTTLRELFGCKGKAKISSTGGTDYNCIVEHAVAHQCRKIVVLTDGYAMCDVEHKKLCLANIEKACVIYAENHTRDEFWREHYHRSYNLKELFRAC